MKLLVLGGTQFVGRAIVEAAIAAGDEITLVHRGIRGHELFSPEKYPNVSHIHFDRNDGHKALRGVQYDAAIDVSAYVPRVALDAADNIAANRYLFVSTISVYDRYSPEGTDENGPLKAEVRDTEEVNGDTYGGLKVACEKDIRACRSDAIIIRPGIVAGAHDPTNRLPYWVRRCAQGGKAIVPDRSEAPLQLIDSRDLANFTLLLARKGGDEAFNVAGETIPFDRMIQACRNEGGESTTPYPLRSLADHGLTVGVDLPLVQSEDGSGDDIFRVDSGKAVAHGLSRRPIEETVAWTADWIRSDDPQRGDAKYGHLTREREDAILSDVKG